MSAIDWIAYIIAYARRMSLLTRTNVWHVSLLTCAFCIFMFLFHDTWQISIGSQMVMVEVWHVSLLTCAFCIFMFLFHDTWQISVGS